MIRPKGLEKTPDQSELHFWVDFLELLCLADVDGEFSVDRLVSRTNMARDLGATDDDAIDGDLSDIEDALLDALDELVDPDIGEVDSHFESALAGVDVMDPPRFEEMGRDAELRDDSRRWSEDVFRLAVDRAAALGDSYPFQINSAAQSIVRRRKSKMRLLYVFFLACSSLSRVKKSDRHVLTTCFERLTVDVMRAVLGNAAEVDVFGTSATSKRFSGNLYSKLGALATELRATRTVSEVDISSYDSADNGLDVVAWIPMRDGSPGVPAFFVQCACGKDWQRKQPEVSHDHWRHFLDLKSIPVPVTAIPYYHRKSGSNWYTNADLNQMLIDRLRAIRFLSGRSDAFSNEMRASAERIWNHRTTVA